MHSQSEHLPPSQSQYYTVLDVQLLGWVAEGYFARSLTAISVEGEAGFPLPQQTGPTQRVPSSTNETLITGFSSRGFATFSLDSSSRVSLHFSDHIQYFVCVYLGVL